VSPTYIPDLVTASLDLLIDGAHGLWHLANHGDVSWAELARKVAVALGYGTGMVDECVSATPGQAALRPAYSVLGTERGQRLPVLDDALARYLYERQPLSPAREARVASERSTAVDGPELRPYRGTAA
jgi:dTDP-4-dehydrorhamnose reductase